MDFLSLPPDEQIKIRANQKAKQLKKRRDKQLKRQALTAAATPPTLFTSPFPTSITQDEYFGAVPEGLFRHPQIKATEDGCRLLLQQDFIAPYNYFMFSGSDKDVWNPEFNAFLAWQGFFTITHGGRHNDGKEVPLPELQPFYGVLLWYNFERSKYVVKELRRLNNIIADQQRKYRLINCQNPQRTWDLLNTYHTAKHGSNWLTAKYFDMMQKADENSHINFTMHCIELYDDLIDPNHESPLSGEIGFSTGKVYTSLSGWTEERNAEGTGTAQLVLLGRWLQQCNYMFWSLGHCYSPAMEYKRSLGHRVFPRQDFLHLLKQHRGEFRRSGSSSGGGGSGGSGGGGSGGNNADLQFSPLQKHATVESIDLIGAQMDCNKLDPPPVGWHITTGTTGSSGATATETKTEAETAKPRKKVKPNAKCPCGSGKKYKKCCR